MLALIVAALLWGMAPLPTEVNANPYPETLLHDLAMRLPAVNDAPKPGAGCNGSNASSNGSLGTSDFPGYGSAATTVVDIWSITRRSTHGAAVGWIAETYNKKLWYLDPAGFQATEITEQNGTGFNNPDLVFHGCFRHPLDKRDLGL
jgi:hypothetical protein